MYKIVHVFTLSLYQNVRVYRYTVPNLAICIDTSLDTSIQLNGVTDVTHGSQQPVFRQEYHEVFVAYRELPCT